MTEQPEKPMPPVVLAVVTDLIFATKIFSTARMLGMGVAGARTPAAVEDALRDGGVALVLLDLDEKGLDPLAILRLVRGLAKPPRIVAFLSHVQADLAVTARSEGADVVMARSAFSQRLPEILRSVTG